MCAEHYRLFRSGQRVRREAPSRELRTPMVKAFSVYRISQLWGVKYSTAHKRVQKLRSKGVLRFHARLGRRKLYKRAL